MHNAHPGDRAGRPQDTVAPSWTWSASPRAWLLAAVAAALITCAAAPRADALATIYFRGAVSTQTGTGASSLALQAPAGLAAGDLLILDVDQIGGTNTIPSGWTAILSNSSWEGTNSTIAYRVATSADVGAGYTVDFSSSVQAVGRLLDYVGTSASPYETDAIGYDGCCGSSTVNYTSVNTTSNGSLVVFGTRVYKSGGSVTMTSFPAGVTTRVNLGTSGGSSEQLGYDGDLIQASSGATGSKSNSLSTNAFWGTDVAAYAPAASGQLAFGVAPTLPALPTVTLNGQVQTDTAQLPDFGVDDTTGTGSGWNVTVQGASGGGLSPVFAQYCPGGACGSAGYVAGGYTLPANSLTLNTTGASWSTQGGAGTTPAFQCNSGCTIDSGTATKIASAAAAGGKGPWSASGFGASSVSLNVPMGIHILPSNEVYRIDLVNTLGSGP